MRWIKLILFLLISTPAWATTYHVSANGSDANDGLTLGTAWATPQKACDTAVAGDIVNFYDDGGIFYTSGTTTGPVAVCNTHSGTSGSHITFQAAPGETPVFEPAKTVGSWTSLGGNLYESDAFISGNNRAATQAWKDTTILTFIGQNCSTTIPDAEGEYCTCNAGCTSNTRIRIYTTGTPGDHVYRAAGALGTGGGAPGSDAFHVDDVSYLDITGINTQYSRHGFFIGSVQTTLDEDTSYITLTNSATSFAANVGIFVLGTADSYTSHITLTNDSASYCGSGGISGQSEHGVKISNNVNSDVGVSDVYVSGGEYHHNNWHGVQTSGGEQNVEITGVNSHDNNQGGHTDAADFRLGLSDPGSGYRRLHGNTASGTQYGIVVYGEISNAEVWGNTISGATTAGIWLDDGASDLFGTGNTINSNVIRDGAIGILVDTHNSNALVLNNTFDNNSGSAIKILSTNTGATIENNAIIAPTGQYLIENVSSAPFTSDYNAFYSPDASPFSYNGSTYSFANYKTASSQDSNSISSNFTNEFTDYSGNDFSISAASTTLKNSGTTLSYVPNDYNGTSRPRGSAYSIGAYEESLSSISGTVTVKDVTLKGVSF